MFIGRRAGFYILAILVILLLAVPNTSRAEEPVKVRLSNGLTVVVEENHAAPVTSIQMWVRVGGADETDREAGISHVFEHMLFKGTKKRKVGEIAGQIESLGGDVNAYTSFDNTVYHVTLPSRHFLKGMDIMADAIQNSSFDKNELKKELEVVLEEIRMNEDDPGRSLYKGIISAAYERHPYKRPVIGYKNVVSKITQKNMLDFFKRWYTPNNMTLVIAGDVETDSAVEAASNAFKHFKPGPDMHRKRPVEPEQKKTRELVLVKDIKEPRIGMAFHIPEIANDDTAAIDVLAAILGGGETSRLYKRLKMEEGLVHDISSYAMSLKEPGLIFVTASLDAKSIDKTIEETLFEIRKLADEGPDYNEIAKAKLNLESEFVYSRETMDGIASKLGYYETNMKDPSYDLRYIENLRKVTANDIMVLVDRYLSTANMTIGAVLPLAQKGRITESSLAAIVANSSSQIKTSKEELKSKAEDAIRRVKLENGMTLIIKEAHANPTVAIYAAAPGGLRYEDAHNNGIGSFTAQMLTRGSKRRTRLELARDTEEIAGSIDGFSGWNSTGVSARFLSRFFDKGLAIFADTLQNPTFPEDEIAKLKIDVLAAIARQQDYLPGYTFKLLYRELYKTHPYGMPTIGTAETVESFTASDLKAHHDRYFSPDRIVVTIVGDVDPDYTIERMKALFKDFNRTESLPASPIAEKPQSEIRKIGQTTSKEQTHIGLAMLGVKIADPDSYALKVLMEVLSGQGGRLFVNLRDKKSLAYSLSAFSKEGVDNGIIGVYIASAPTKTDEAISSVIDELKSVTETPITEDELKRAKNSIIGGYEIGLQSVGAQAANIANNELYGLGYDFDRKFPEKIDAIDAAAVENAAKKYLRLDAYTISIVGPNWNTADALKEEKAQNSDGAK